MAKLWAGRFQKETDLVVNDFNSSILFDCRLYKEDITGSIAHATMLGRQGIIEEHEAAPERTGWQLFRQGFLVNITNPKGLVFFISLLTPFINTDAPILLQYFEMGLTCGFTDFCVMTGVSLAAAAVASRMKGARNVTRMNRVFGTVFVLIGCGLFFFNL